MFNEGDVEGVSVIESSSTDKLKRIVAEPVLRTA